MEGKGITGSFDESAGEHQDVVYQA